MEVDYIASVRARMWSLNPKSNGMEQIRRSVLQYILIYLVLRRNVSMKKLGFKYVFIFYK